VGEPIVQITPSESATLTEFGATDTFGNMTSRAAVTRALDNADRQFQRCWEQLCVLKGGRTASDVGRIVLEYQPQLYRGLLTLNESYRSIRSEESRLISGKGGLDPRWFAARMDKLKHYRQALQHAIGVGQILGDGFAWIFYERDSDLIDQHLTKPRQLLFPSGIGRIGERAVLEMLQGRLGRQLILYHGLTSFLRLGDITFIDSSTMRVSRIGELKTMHLGGDQYQITIGYVTGSKKNFIVPHIQHERPCSYRLSEQVTRRLQRQMKEMSAAIKSTMPGPNDEHLNTSGEFHFAELEQVIAESGFRRLAHVLAGPGLALCALRRRGRRRLALNLLGKVPDIQHRISNVTDIGLLILEPALKDNALFIADLVTRDDSSPIILRGTVPLVWWPVADRHLYDIIFGNVIVITLYNPSHLWESLREIGFDVEVDSHSRLLKLRRAQGELRVELGNLQHFDYLIRFFLMSERTFIRIIEQTVSGAMSKADGQSNRMRLNPRMSRKPSPRPRAVAGRGSATLAP
jgi:hypothetical protein